MKHNYNEYNINATNPILLLHGWGGSIDSLKTLAEKLSQKIPNRIINLELPGFGSTPLTKDIMSSQDYAEFVLDFLKRKEITEIILIGHSFGGKVALNLALTSPTIVEKLILINTSGIKPKNNLKRLLFKTFALLAPDKVKNSEKIRKIFYKKIVRENDYLNAGELKPTLSRIIQEHMDHELNKINAETLIIWSQNDNYVPSWMGKKLKKGIKNSILRLVPDEGHGLPLTNPELTSQLICEFLIKS